MLGRRKITDAIAEFVGNPLKRFGVPGEVVNDHAPARQAHLSRIKRIRERTLPKPPGQDFGYLALSIPEFDYYVLQQRFPDLKSPDHEIRLKAWKKFIASPLSEPYRVNRNDGRRVFSRAGSVSTPIAR